MSKQINQRGGTVDGPRSRPPQKKEAEHDKILGDELDDSFSRIGSPC